MTNAALTSHSVPARKAGQRFTRFVRTSLKPVVVKLSRKLSVTYWPQRRRTISLVLVALLTQFVPGFAAAAPTGGAVVAGSAAITQVNSTNMLINQQSQNAILNWQSFSIGAGEAVRFVQPNASAVALNRVVGADPSRIFGALSANGKVFLVNNAGVYFAPGAQVDVGALVASSMNISNANFMSGKYQFDAGANAGAVSNEGSLKGAFVVLAAPRVSNAGSIQTPGGAAALAAGGRVTLDMAGDRMVSLSVDAATANAAVQNSGNISAEGGKVFMTARSANAVLDTVINTTGIVRAASIVSRNGEIVIDGGRAGVVAVGGTLAAAGASGGSVKVLGDAVKLSASAVVDVSGDTGGGKAMIGGDFHGAGAGRNATTTEVAKGAVIKADAIRSGDGGQVAVWSDDATRFAGSISAKGGAAGGNGGFVETSGKNTLAYSGRVDTTAAKGKTGNLLLDPGDIVISDDPDDAGVSPVVVNAGALVTSLQSSNIEIHTDSGTSGPGDITVAANLPRSDANLLTLTAAHDIALNGGISISNSMNGGLFLHADGAVTLNGAVNLNGGEFAVRGMAGGASLAGSIIGASSVATANGNVTMRAIGTVSTGSIDAGAGTIGLTSNAGTTITGPLRSADLNVNGGVSQTAGSAVLVDHEAVFTAGVGNNIVLGEAANDFATVEVTSAKNVEMRDANSAAYKINTVGDSTLKTAAAMSVEGQTRDLITESAALTYGPLRVNRDLGSTATGAVNQVGGVTALTVLGTAAITATGQAVTLNHALNDFDGRLTLTAASATITDANALSARLDVAANATLTATTGLIVDGDVHGDLNTTSNALTFGPGPTRVSGNLASAALGQVDQAGALQVGGTSTIATPVQAQLTNAANDFGGLLTLLTGPAQITDANALTAQLNTTGAVSLTAAAGLTVDGIVRGSLDTHSAGLTFGLTDVRGALSDLSSTASGAVAQTGALTVGGASTISAAGQSVLLTDAGNNFAGALTLTAGSTQIKDANALTAHLDIAADATLTSVTDLIVDGAVHGSLQTDSVGLTFGPTAVGGTLTSVATGAVGQTSGALTVGGASSITATGQPVVLTNAGNDFVGALTVKAGSAQLTDANALTAHLDIAADATITSLSDLVVDGDVLGTLDTHSAALTYGVTTVGGNLVAVATGDVGQTGKLAVGGTSNISAAGQTVALNDPANNFVGAVTVDATTVLLSDVDVLTAHLDTTTDSTVTAPNGLFVDGRVRGNLATHSVALTFGATKVEGNLVSVATGPVDQTGALVVDGTSDITATGRPVMLTHAGNDFVGALTLRAGSANVSDSNALTVDGTIAGNLATISDALTFGATTVTGDLSAVANGAVGQTGILTVGGASSITATGQSVTLNTAGNHFGGALTLGADTAAIRDTDTLTAHLNTTGITTLATVAGLAVDGVAGGLNADSADLTFGVTRVNGNLSATASGTVGQTGALTVTGASTITAVDQKVLLTNAGNDFVDAVGLTAGEVAVTDANALTFATTKVSGPLSIVTGGTVSQTGTLAVDGATSITATGHAVTLDHAGNDFVGTLSVNAGSAQIKDANTLAAHLDIAADATLTAISDLVVDGHVRGNLDTSSAALTYGATTVDGNLLAAATGNVGQAGRLAVGGTSNISAPGRSVVLTDPANDFGGVVTVNAADVQLSDTNVLTARLDISTNASVTAPGDLVVDGRVRGNLDTHSVALTFGGTKVDGNLVSVATGAVKQTGALMVDGTSSITANGQSVALADAGNDFVGDLTLNAGAATVADKNALTAHLSTAAATLSAGGALVLNGQVGGKLDTHSGALTFGTTTVTGDLAAVATGAVGQSGILTVAGASAISATGQSLLLANPGNDFAGDLTVSAGAAVINDANALTAHLATTGNADLTAAAGVSADGSVGGDLITHSVALSFGTTKVTGNLASVATGAVGQTGALAVSGASSINATGHEITLEAAANDFGGAVTVTAGATTIADANALTAHLTTGAATLSAGAALVADGTTAGNLTTNSAALTFGPTTVTGNLSSVAGGAVGQTGALVVTGASAITASGQSLLLANAGNDFTGDLTLGAATATIRDANALTAHLTTAGATDLAAANALTVDGASGTLHTASTALTLGTTKVTGDLVSNASGAVGQTGALTVSGSSRITATGQSVLLTEAGNNFVGTLALDAGSAKVTDKDALGGLFNVAGNLDITSGALTFGTSKIGGNLVVQAAGDVTQGALPSPALSSLDGATILLASLTGSAGAPISVTGTTRINAGTNRVILADLGNDLVGAVSASGSSVTLRDSNILTVDKITAPSVDLGAKSELQMVAGGLVNADAIAIAVDDTKGAIGTPTNNFAVKPGSTVTFGSNMPAVAAYFAAFPAPFFAFKSDSTRLGYATNPDLLLVDNHFHEIRLITDGLAPFTSSISRILQAAQKRADSFADRLERGMLVKLDEAPFYQHYGQLALKSPQCSNDPVSRRADGSVVLKGPDCEN